MQEVVRTMSSLQSDFVASFLRSQLVTLQNILSHIESSQKVEDVYPVRKTFSNGVYVEESLRRVGKELCWFRKFRGSN